MCGNEKRKTTPVAWCHGVCFFVCREIQLASCLLLVVPNTDTEPTLQKTLSLKEAAFGQLSDRKSIDSPERNPKYMKQVLLSSQKTCFKWGYESSSFFCKVNGNGTACYPTCNKSQCIHFFNSRSFYLIFMWTFVQDFVKYHKKRKHLR